MESNTIKRIFNENNIKDKAFLKNMEALSNRHVIQYLRHSLFKKVDFQPKNLVKQNLLNSQIMDDIFYEIKYTAADIIDLLKENKEIYNMYFMEKPIQTRLITTCKDVLLPGEEEEYQWDIHYFKWIKTFARDGKRLVIDPIGYHQKLYEFIIMDMTYGDIYDNIEIIDDDD